MDPPARSAWHFTQMNDFVGLRLMKVSTSHKQLGLLVPYH
jgi:hypothetical protein